ncbi:hypothetical protein ACVI1J_004755 [Bradyrhizobium diazoefficiens]
MKHQREALATIRLLAGRGSDWSVVSGRSPHRTYGLTGNTSRIRFRKPITPKERPRGENVVDLMDTLRKSVDGAAAEIKAPKKGAKKPRKAAAGEKEMLMPIVGKKPAKEAAAKKPAARAWRKSA